MAPKAASSTAAIPAEASNPLAAAALPPSQHPVTTYMLRLGAPSSRRTMLAALDRIAELVSGGSVDALGFPWWRLQYAHCQAIRAELAASYAPASANLGLAALRGVLRECFRLGLMTGEHYHRAVDIPSIRGTALPRGRALTAGEIRALFAACEGDDSAAGARDAAIIGLLYGCGLRRSEVVGLDADHLDLEAGELRVLGKGRRERRVHVNGGAVEALAGWLQARGAAPGPLFTGVNPAGRIEVRRLSSQAVYLVCRKRAKQAGVSAFSPHDLRRTFVSDLLDAGVDLAVVKELAGHSHLATTARYDRRPEARKRVAAQLLHVPYRRP